MGSTIVRTVAVLWVINCTHTDADCNGHHPGLDADCLANSLGHAIAYADTLMGYRWSAMRCLSVRLA